MRFLSTLAMVVLASTSLFAACKGGGSGGSGGGTPTITCDPGEEIFCRCPGGDPGTKTCNPDGHSFDDCITRSGSCPDISSSSSSSSGGGTGGFGGTGGTGGMTGGGGTGGTGGALGGYLDPCGGSDADCQSGMCRYGYCTKECAKYDECTLGVGECISFMGEQICMPVCTDTGDCLATYANPSACGYTTAVDGTPVTTCSDWLTSLEVPPEGTNCDEDLGCHLGNDGVQSVCAFGACTKGCYGQSDCPTNTSCSSSTNLGHCE